MEGLERRTALSELVGQHLRNEMFTLIDVGCRDGIDVGWRSFGSRLRAFGFDPNIAECTRLTLRERDPNVRYIPAFVAIPPDHPFALKKADRQHYARNPWDRLSAARSLEIISKNVESLSSRERTELNLWQTTELADPADPVYLVKFFDENKIDQVDFIKIDVDGADFEILSSLDSSFDRLEILGIGIEVNYVGSECETDHTFHNIDRFLRSYGFDLFGLTVRRYSNKCLPSKYRGPAPGPTEFGRPLQGDALYLRDPGGHESSSLFARMSAEKIAKLAAIFSLFQLPDVAAETLLNYRAILATLFDVDHCLDLLACQAQIDVARPLPYREYMAAFEANSPMFYRGKFWPLSDSLRLARQGLRRLRARLVGPY